MYENKKTGEFWKLSHVETDRYFPDGVNKQYKKTYVLENGDRWAEDLFFQHFRPVVDGSAHDYPESEPNAR